jgi:hypothetical protein
LLEPVSKFLNKIFLKKMSQINDQEKGRIGKDTSEEKKVPENVLK